MKYFSILLFSLTALTASAEELKQGSVFTGYTAEEPEMIQISIKDDAAELMYRKLNLYETRKVNRLGVTIIEKVGKSVKCSKFIVSTEEVYDCQISMKSSGTTSKPL